MNTRTTRLVSVWAAAGMALGAPSSRSPGGLLAAGSAPPRAIIAYVFPRDRVIDPAAIAADRLTHINYAFANIRDGVMVEGSPRDADNFKALAEVRRRHPHLKLLVSVGGWTWSGGFSDMAASAEARGRFVASAVDFVRRHDLDGLDVDWEYPGLPGYGNPHRPADKEAFTALMAELRAALDRDGAARGRRLLLTFAAGAFPDFIAHTEMDKVHSSVDFVNLMTYDFREAEGDPLAGHHSNLFLHPHDPRQISADRAVRDFHAAGVPREKLVLGVPFYGRAWGDVDAKDDGLYQPGKAPQERLDTSYGGLSRLPGRDGWVRRWDETSQAPWLWNAATRTFVAYDDPQSLRLKARYARDEGLGGVMFWEYGADPTGALLDALATGLRGPDTADRFSLAGAWRFELDRDDEGLVGSWYSRRLGQSIALPGLLQAQGFGDEVGLDTRWTGQIVDRSFFEAPRYERYRQPGQVKVPFWLQPDRHYVGAAWYQKDIEIPQGWQGRRVVLTLERPHWQTLVWLDGRAIGSNDSLSTAHEHDLGTTVTPGRHVITIRVDNRLVVDVGTNSHSVSDHTQGNWNGIVGRIELRASSRVFLHDLQVYPHVASRSATIRGRIGNATGEAGRGTLRLAVASGLAAELAAGAAAVPNASKAVDVTWEAGGGTFELDYPLGADARTWDEFEPVLHRLEATLEAGGETDARAVSFGLREITTEGTRLVMNGRTVFIRGTLECAIFPKTGHPPTDVESWRRIVRIAKSHGLNHIRFHSWCPPEAAFRAADELGFTYQVEIASWANGSTRLGMGLPIDTWLYREADRILGAYGNHPSFLLMAYGNEPAGRHEEYLARFVRHYREKDPRRLYTSAAGWPQIAENQFHVAPAPRIQAWGAGLTSRVNAKPPETRTDYRQYVRERTVPVVSHEIGQWCVYPNLAERAKYTGYLKAKNFDTFADSLAASGMADQAAAFLHASGRLQALLYKEEIESALRTPGMGGFQLLDLHDFPGQGTALVGVLDPFWDSKGYLTAEEFRRFCHSTVPLARLARRVFTTAEVLEAEIELSHFGPFPLAKAVAAWRLEEDGGRVVARGTLPARDVSIDNPVALGRVRIPLSSVAVPRRCRLVVGLSGTPFENDWDVWVYPPRVDTRPPAGVTVARGLDGRALEALARGGRVLLLLPPDRLRGDALGKVALGFSSIFWNTAWTSRQAPHTLGILCDPKHPALTAFPTDAHSNWQWWYLVSRAGAMILDGLPGELRPTVQVIDDWFTNRRLGLVFEARVAGGRLLVSSIDLDRDLAGDPVARQMRHSLLRYMASERFRPTVELTADEVRALTTQAAVARR